MYENILERNNKRKHFLKSLQFIFEIDMGNLLAKIVKTSDSYMPHSHHLQLRWAKALKIVDLEFKAVKIKENLLHSNS